MSSRPGGDDEAVGDRLARRLRGGETLFVGWSAIPDPLVAEVLARAGYDGVALDMQHGCHDTDSVLRGIGAISLAGKPALVRIPLGRFDMASRALDFGAQAVIAPMVNRLEDAQAFAAAVKFPPLGARSWGPSRAIMLHGYPDLTSYLCSANTGTLAIAMVETRDSLALLDDILALDGIDGVLVGPSDFSLAWSEGRAIDPGLRDMMPAIENIARRTNAAGKLAAVFAVTADMARRYHDMGYRLIALSSDINCLTAGAAALLAAARA